MDRRTFARLLPAVTLGLAGFRDGGPAEPVPPVVVPPSAPPPPPPPLPPPQYNTAAERAWGVVQGLLKSGQTTAGGVRWPVRGSGGITAYPADLYECQAGVLTFLAEAYRVRPEGALRSALEEGGRWLRSSPGSWRGLFDGSAGRAWAFLSLHEALGAESPVWLEAALELAPNIAATPGGLIGDIINGAAGQGLLLLRLHEVTGDARWLDGARTMADAMLARAVASGEGIKIPSFNDPSGVPVCYTGLAHGSAGAGYFLCRLAQALPASQSTAYADGAEGIAAWLNGLAQVTGPEVRWYRREPDQMNQLQVTWCHGPPGIGIFYAEMHRLTARAEHLQMAVRCAATVYSPDARLINACQCHGGAGNAQLFLKLYRETGDRTLLEKADSFGDRVWISRYANEPYPAWPSGDGRSVNNPGLMTGTAGVGWLYLQFATDGTVNGPVTY